MPRGAGRFQTTFEGSFVIKGAKLWNKLPAPLTEIKNLNSFKSRLEKFLKLFPDEPPVHGYYHKNNNSILDYNISTETVFKNKLPIVLNKSCPILLQSYL